MPQPPHPAAGEQVRGGGSRFGAWFALWFGDERRFWMLATIVFGTFAFLKGLSAPGNWALTQAELDYSHGFIKRGLQGALLGLLHIRDFYPLCAYFFLQTAILFLLLIFMTKKARVQDRFGSLAPAAIFWSSYAITFITFAVGYTDIPLAILLTALLLIARSSTRFACSLVAVPLALLVHEDFLVLFLPVLLFSFVLDAALTPKGTRRRNLLCAGTLGLLAVAITLAIAGRPHLSVAESDEFARQVQARVDFPIRANFFGVLAQPLSSSVHEAAAGLRDPKVFVPNLASLINLLPAVLLLLYLVRRLIRTALHEHEAAVRTTIWIAALFAVLAPLALYVIGTDGNRWNAVSALAAYLVLLLLCRALPAGRAPLSNAERNAAMFVLAINMATGFGLFYDSSETMFPFFPILFSVFR